MKKINLKTVAIEPQDLKKARPTLFEEKPFCILLEKVSADYIDDNGHVENGRFYNLVRPSTITAISKLPEEDLIQIFGADMEEMKHPRRMRPYRVFEEYTRQILIHYGGGVTMDFVRLEFYKSSIKNGQIQFCIEIFQDDPDPEVERTDDISRMLLTIGKPENFVIERESLEGYMLLRSKETYELKNLAYGKRGMVRAAMMDNTQTELGHSIEWLTGKFFYDMKEFFGEAFMFSQANFLFTGAKILRPAKKKGYIVETYVKESYQVPKAIRAQMVQLIYTRNDESKQGKILVGIFLREAVFVDIKKHKATRVNVFSPEEIRKQQILKKFEKTTWPAIWPIKKIAIERRLSSK